MGLSLASRLEGEGSHLFFIPLSPPPAERKRAGRVFLGSCSCTHARKATFPKAGWSSACPSSWETVLGEGFGEPRAYLWVAKWGLGLAQPKHFGAVARGFLTGRSEKRLSGCCCSTSSPLRKRPLRLSSQLILEWQEQGEEHAR